MQKIYTGSCNSLKEILAEIKTKKFLLVCDKSYDFIRAKDIIDKISIPYVKFDEFTPNPLYEDVRKGVLKFSKEKCDTIVAIGGGSTIDVAKCIKLYSEMDKDVCFLQQEYKDTAAVLIAIPTTAGTGSESTRFAVIYYEGNKQSVAHTSIVPDYAVLDSSLLKTLPLYQKKCTLMDALCQGIESWWSVNSTKESIGYSKKAVKLILENMESYLMLGNEEASQKIMEASNYAGRAINITQTTAAHAMSYKLTSMYGLPHGHAVALCLPEVLRKMTEDGAVCIDKRGAEYLHKIFEDIAATFGLECPNEMITAFEKMLDKLELGKPTTATKEADVERLTTSVNITRLSNNPVRFDDVLLKAMYERIVQNET